MTSKVENSIEIERPVSEVFSFVDDYQNTTRYIVGMVQYRPTTAQTSGKGARFSMVKKTNGLPDIKSVVEIVDWEQNRTIGFRSISGFENSGSYKFTVSGDGTTVRLVNAFDITTLLGGGGGFLGGLKKAALGATASIAEGQARRDLTTSLDHLKRLVESTPRKTGKAPAERPAARVATAQSAKKSSANGRATPGEKPTKK